MDEFVDAREVVASLSGEYEACEHADYVSRGWCSVLDGCVGRQLECVDWASLSTGCMLLLEGGGAFQVPARPELAGEGGRTMIGAAGIARSPCAWPRRQQRQQHPNLDGDAMPLHTLWPHCCLQIQRERL